MTEAELDQLLAVDADWLKRANCVDCGVDTINLGEYYTLHDAVWPLDRRAGMLCIGCLEQRLGRRLIAADFSDVPVNFSDDYRRSMRLTARLSWATCQLELPLGTCVPTPRAVVTA